MQFAIKTAMQCVYGVRVFLSFLVIHLASMGFPAPGWPCGHAVCMVCTRGLVGAVTIVDKMAAKIDFTEQIGAGTFATQWVYQKDFINLRVEDDEAGRDGGRWWKMVLFFQYLELLCIFCILCFNNKCFFPWILVQGAVRSCLLQQSFFLALRIFFCLVVPTFARSRRGFW